METDSNKLLESFKQWLMRDKKHLSYIIVTIKLPWSADKIKEITEYWASHEFMAIANDLTVRTVLLKELKWNENILKKAIQIADIHFFKYFPLVGFLAEKEKLNDLRRLPFVEYVHEISEEESYTYLNIVDGLNFCLEHNESEKISKINVINLSLQPLKKYPFCEKEAMNVATKILAEKGITVIVASGNYGEEGNNTLNPWSVAPWVIGVGAAYPGGKRLWEKSSKGIPGDPLYHPTVVAPGVGVTSLRAPEGVYEAADPEGKFAIADGTSFAAPQVSAIAARIIEFINNLAKSSSAVEWQRMAELQLNIKVLPLISSPDLIKKMIQDMAVKMSGCGLHESGAGFVDNEIASSYFRNFKISNFMKLFTEGGVQNVVL